LKELGEIITEFTKHSFVKHSFYAFYPHRVWNQQLLWNKYLPQIQPYYAIKSNPEHLLIQNLFPRGVKFDCASLQELKLVKDILPKGSDYNNLIIYANPCKSYIDLEYAQKEVGSPTTVVDSFEELDKLVDISYEGGALIRISVDDKNSKIPFSGKFGLEHEKVVDLGIYAKSKHIDIKGISFHVGSGGNDGKIYYKSIEAAKALNTQLQSYHRQSNIIDIGGGFLSDEYDFSKKAKYIQDAYDKKFCFLAEPGRFFSNTCQDFFVKVIGKKPWKDGWRYTIDDSLYGQFSCIPFDQAKPLWMRVPTDDMEVRPKTKGLLMGRTCDSVDVIARCESMESLEIGDWLWFPHMGSYTNATANEFNGFPKPPVLTIFMETPDIHSSEFIERVPESFETVEPLSSKQLLS
jgi:ornithine decarboxylase